MFKARVMVSFRSARSFRSHTTHTNYLLYSSSALPSSYLIFPALPSLLLGWRINLSALHEVAVVRAVSHTSLIYNHGSTVRRRLLLLLFLFLFLAVLIDNQSSSRTFGPRMINHKELLSKIAPFLTFTLPKMVKYRIQRALVGLV